MPSLMKTVTSFARSRQGRQLAEKAQQWAKDPKNKQKIADARDRLTKRG